MPIAEVLGIVLGLITIGAAIVTALIRTLFLGLRSRMDRMDDKVDRCMEQMIRLAKGGGDGS